MIQSCSVMCISFCFGRGIDEINQEIDVCSRMKEDELR